MSNDKRHSGNKPKPPQKRQSASKQSARLQPLNLLEELLNRRFHGASNVRGVQYQLLYFCLRAFDLYNDNGPDALVGEGLEDVDLHSIALGNEYIQAKQRGRPVDWSDLENVLKSFRDELIADPSARFKVVTNSSFVGDAEAVRKITEGNMVITVQMREKLNRLLGRKTTTTLDTFISRLSFECITEEQIYQQVTSSVALIFGVVNGNEKLYVQALFKELTDRSGNRVEVVREDLERLRADIEQLIARGTVNPAVRDGFVSPLEFDTDDNVDDYYDGRSARPAHIAAHMDIPRPEIIAQVDDVLQRHRVCVIVASSGQGKSTLGYRYCKDHDERQAAFIIRNCQSENEVGQICLFLQSQLRIGLPVIILVDNLSSRTRLWYRVAEKMAGTTSSFLVTAREEDWFLYGGHTIAFTWEIVRPTLSLNAANGIYMELLGQDRVVPEIVSPEAVFERIGEKRLLIEYIYLLTHGFMIHERLKEQVVTMRETHQDRGKIEAIRLASVAHYFGVRIRVEDLMKYANFEGDSQQGLASLEGEYLVYSNGYCEGLHFIRSEHLMRILHDPVPIESTLEKLIAWIEPAELAILVRTAFASIEVDAFRLMQPLVTRVVSSEPTVISEIAASCFQAQEDRYYREHAILFNQTYEDQGNNGVHMLAIYTMPCGHLDPFGNLAKTMEDAKAPADYFHGITEKFKPRVAEDRLEHKYLTATLAAIDGLKLATNLISLTETLQWCCLAKVEPELVVEILLLSDWESTIFNMPIHIAASMAFAISKIVPNEYAKWTHTNRSRIFGFFKLFSRTIIVREKCDDILIGFPVDFELNAPSLNEQSFNRVRLLHRLLPGYRTYRSNGIYLLGDNNILEYDPTTKAIEGSGMWQEFDTSRNASWIQLCQAKYSCDSLATWLSDWKKLRYRAFDLVQQMVHLYERLYQKKHIEQNQIRDIFALISALRSAFKKLPLIPTHIPEDYSNHINTLMKDWKTNFSYFLLQYEEHDPNNVNDHYSRLMRTNLKNAMYGLPKLTEALTDVARIVESEIPHEVHPRTETTAYKLLADFLDYWFESSHIQLPNPRQAMSEWRRSQALPFVNEVQLFFEPLINSGLRITLPTQWLVDFPLISICIGLEVEDALNFNDDILAVVYALAEAKFEYSFLYIVPTIKKRQYQHQMYRVARCSIEAVANDDIPNSMWIFPVDSPVGIEAVLPNITYNPLLELDLLTKFLADIGRIFMQVRLQALAEQKLDLQEPFEAEYLQQIKSEVNVSIQSALENLRFTVRQMEDFSPPNHAMQQWEAMTTYSRSLIPESQESGFATRELYELDTSIQFLIGSYINVAYIKLT